VQNLLIVIAIALVFTALGTIWLLRRNVKLLHASRADLQRLNLGLESAVAARTADFKRANEEIQRFAYIVSHDLRSPLVNVMGFTAELQATQERLARFLDDLAMKEEALVSAEADMAVREDLPEAIEFIRSSSERMDRLINAILGLSRQGRRVLQPEPLPMDQVLRDIAGSLATMAEERGAEIVVEGPLPEITHDRIAIEQIFTNLMENALKYLKPGIPGQVRIRGRSDGDKVVFEVEDNGRGIKETDFQRVFDLFRRSGVQDQPGEGIGLANVRALAYRLGGTVALSSRFGEGSVFAVTLPQEFHVDERDDVA
jgi:signal transduction histidine kinase